MSDSDREPDPRTTQQYSYLVFPINFTLLTPSNLYCLHAAGMLARQRRLREGKRPSRHPYYKRAKPPAQRPAEVLGTLAHAQLAVIQSTVTVFLCEGIGSGQRQLIAVTCIAEHA